MDGPIQHPPAFCNQCKLIFPCTLIAIGIDGTVSVLADTPVPCPRCQGQALLLRGTYKAFSDRFDMFINDDIPLQAKIAVAEIIKNVQNKEMSLEEAKIAAEKIDKRFSRVFDLSDWSDVARSTLFSAILVSVSTLTVAAATIAGPYFAAPPTVIVEPGLTPDFLNRLSDSVSRFPFSSPGYDIKLAQEKEANHPSGDSGPKRGTKNHRRKKHNNR